MKKIIDWIGKDGLLHFVACFLIAVVLGLWIHPAAAAFIALFVGFLKEIVWDAKLKKGTFQWKGILFDFIGSAVALILMLL